MVVAFGPRLATICTVVAIDEPVELVKRIDGAGEVLAAGVGHGDFAGDGQAGGRAAIQDEALPAVGRAGGRVAGADQAPPTSAGRSRSRRCFAAETAAAAAGDELARSILRRLPRRS